MVMIRVEVSLVEEPRILLISSFSMRKPKTKNRGKAITAERNGSIPHHCRNQKAGKYMASTAKEAWAKLMIFITPKINVSPAASTA